MNCALGFSINDFGKGVTQPNSLKQTKCIQKVRFPAGIGANENIHRPQLQLHIFEAFEILDFEALDHGGN